MEFKIIEHLNTPKEHAIEITQLLEQGWKIVSSGELSFLDKSLKAILGTREYVSDTVYYTHLVRE